MLSPAFLLAVSGPVLDIYAQVEQDIIADAAKRIVKMGRVSPATISQINRGREFGFFRDGVEKELASATGMSKRTIKKLMNQAGAESLKYDDAIYRLAGKHPIAVAKSPALQAMILQGTDTTLQLMGNLTRSMAASASVVFQSTFDRAYMQIMSGAFDPQTAIHRAVNDLARQGITKIKYDSGQSISVEAGVRRAVTTGVNQSTGKLQLLRAREMDSQYVETTSHAGARPSHAVWQGRVFALWNPTKEYPDFYSVTGYGTGEGLCGWNCYHNFYPFFLGLSERSFSHDSAADAGRNNAVEYEQQQEQRYYERQIRAAKLECVTYNAAREAARTEAEAEQYISDFQKASVKLKRREAKLNEFLDKTGRSREAFREQVGGFDRSVSSRAVWANRKAQ